ncbi:glycoside hydrolase superfamily [Fomitopsis serialis]|uniref:glycoside hydrolase superfamily n=1 Tax=Fomitopsis serialis TaxID=139415 RepID=UPI00200896A8|nr:glycoside hydrolase superfamily [Neoantrodia serialis]KAH9921423.1 glycoside hydrolase superfamily [Neoantrodia serialis]
MKVLRVWLDGEAETQKGTNINPSPNLEPVQICNGVASCYNDTVLDRLDDFMVLANSYGIKLLIDMHSFNALSAGDVYGAAYGIADFYTNTTAQEAFDARLNSAITYLGIEAENEAMIGNGQASIEDHQQWQCDRATTIKTELNGNTGPEYLTCPSLDVISIHAYAVTDYYTSSIDSYVQQAVNAGKMLIMEEWGTCYYNTSNNNCSDGGALPADTRNANIQGWAANITAAGLPWLYWEVIPNADPHWDGDSEIGVVDDPSWTTLQQAAQDALNAPAAFDFSAYLL